MSRIFCLLLLVGACDDMQPAMCFGQPLAAGLRCCPNADPVTGFATGPCSPVGESCVPGATDIACACETSGWVCHSTFPRPDLSFPVSD